MGAVEYFRYGFISDCGVVSCLFVGHRQRYEVGFKLQTVMLGLQAAYAFQLAQM